MPSQEDIAKAAERRELRKLAREANIEQAYAQEAQLSDVVAKAKAAPAKAPKPARPVKEVRAELRKQNEQEADQQERDIAPPEGEVEVAKFNGRVPTLQELNRLARQQTRSFKIGARTVARAAGKAAYDTAMRDVPHLGPKRHKRARDAQDAMAAAQAKAKAAAEQNK